MTTTLKHLRNCCYNYNNGTRSSTEAEEEREYTLGYFNENHITITTADKTMTFTSNGHGEIVRDGLSVGRVIGFYIAKESSKTFMPETLYLHQEMERFKDLTIYVRDMRHLHPTPDMKGLSIETLPIDVIEVEFGFTYSYMDGRPNDDVRIIQSTRTMRFARDKTPSSSVLISRFKAGERVPYQDVAQLVQTDNDNDK